MKRRGVKPSDPYDWEKTPGGDNVTTGLPNQEPAPTAPSTLARHTRVHTVDNNQENVEPTDNKDIQLESRRRRIETETTAPLVTDTQTNQPRAVDKNCNATAAETAPIQGKCDGVRRRVTDIYRKNYLAAPRRRATSHLDTPITDRAERLDNDAVSTPRSTSDANQAAAVTRSTPLRKSASGVATLGRLRVGGTGQVEQEQERPRRRQQNVSRRTRDTSLTQFAVIDDENVSQQVTIVVICCFVRA